MKSKAEQLLEQIHAKNEKLKEQLLMVAEEEKKHVILLDGLVEYLSRPKDWVEHAMFTQPRPEY